MFHWSKIFNYIVHHLEYLAMISDEIIRRWISQAIIRTWEKLLKHKYHVIYVNESDSLEVIQATQDIPETHNWSVDSVIFDIRSLISL